MRQGQILIVRSERFATSETFIRDQHERIPENISGFGAGLTLDKHPRRSRLIARAASLYSWMRRGPNHHANALAAEWTLRMLRPRVVLANFGPTALQLLRPCRKLGIPLVVHFHGYDASVHALKERYPELFDYAAAIVAVSKAMHQRLISWGAPVEKMSTIHYGVSTEAISPRTFAAPNPVVVAAGRFVDKKGPHLTLLAFKRVCDSLPTAQLRWIGGGPLLGSCKSLAIALGIQERVVFLGECNHATTLAEIAQARCFVQHSIRADNGDEEGLPVAILEASASGVPTVSTYHAGIPEAILDGITGFLVNEGDTSAMAQRVLSLLNDSELAFRMGQNGRRFVVNHHDSRRQSSLLHLLLEAAASKPTFNVLSVNARWLIGQN